MNVVYQFWESNKGLEEHQATIYNKITNNSVTAQSITDRLEREKIDKKTVRYAFTEEGNPLAYIQARDYPSTPSTIIGYPWALKDCPPGVQDKLFDEMLDYLKTREIAKEYPIRFTTNAKRTNVLEFIKTKNFVEISKNYAFRVDLDTLSNSSFSGTDYEARLATMNDIDILVKLLTEDGSFTGALDSEDAKIDYFKNRVLKEGLAVLVFENNNLVMAAAPLIVDNDRLILRFHAFLKNKKDSFHKLIIGIAKECIASNYGIDFPLSINVNEKQNPEFSKILNEYKADKIVSGYSFELEK